MPSPDWCVSRRYFWPIWSAVASCGRLKELNCACAICCPLAITAMPAAPAPSTAAAMPATIDRSIGTVALAMAAEERSRCPPAIWPVSCASTPLSSFGVRSWMKRPELMKMF